MTLSKAYGLRTDPGRYKTKLEERYAARLELQKRGGLILDWRYEPFNVRLADGVWYKVDWLVVAKDGTLELHETKGYHKNIRQSVTKWRVAAHEYPWFRWLFVTLRKGRWEVSEYPGTPASANPKSRPRRKQPCGARRAERGSTSEDPRREEGAQRARPAPTRRPRRSSGTDAPSQ